MFRFDEKENTGAILQFDGGWRMGISVLNVQFNFGKEKCMSVLDSQNIGCFALSGKEITEGTWEEFVKKSNKRMIINSLIQEICVK